MSIKSTLTVAMGCMTFGEKGAKNATVHDLDSVSSIITAFKKHGHSILDTAGVYTEGHSERYLGVLKCKNNGFEIHTKICPEYGQNKVVTLNAEDIRKNIDKSLASLQTDSLDLFYLHAPDRKIPLEVTLEAINDLHKEGKFRRFGISNYMAWEVAEIFTICKFNSWITPSVYQGVYNGIQRAIEPELIPCLRKYGISFYSYNPLAGGMLAGRYQNEEAHVGNGARFDINTSQGKAYRYWSDNNFKAISIISLASRKEGLTMAETAFRWLSHHSELKNEYGDAVIIGASSIQQAEHNLIDLEKGPLPQSLVDAYEEAWQLTKADVFNYWK